MVKRNADFLFFRADGVQVPEIKDQLQPGMLDTEPGQGLISVRSGTGPAWRLPAKHGFNRTGSRQRAEWQAYVAAMQR
ncbi:MAG: hypothetical protein EA417_22180 [Gammaproteobacteria bacterium]|nr:MAG: hypothetical protein EA417_22180 [Gammaproteobacteria bacterium]